MTPPLAAVHVESFFLGMCREVGGVVLGSVERAGLHRVTLGRSARELTGIDRRFTEVAFDPAVVDANKDVTAVDMELDLLRSFVSLATSDRFGGRYARASGLGARILVMARLRWHDDLGRRRRTSVRVLVEEDNGQWSDDPLAVSSWLSGEARDAGGSARTRAEAAVAMNRARAALERLLAKGSNTHLHPAELEIVAIAAGPRTDAA